MGAVYRIIYVRLKQKGTHMLLPYSTKIAAISDIPDELLTSLLSAYNSVIDKVEEIQALTGTLEEGTRTLAVEHNGQFWFRSSAGQWSRQHASS